MIRTICLGLLAAILVAPASAQVKPRVLPVSADAPFVHANSGLTLPVALVGLPRTQVREFQAPELDVVANWIRGDDELSVYVYRSTAGSVPVWFDRAAWAVTSHEVYGTPTLTVPITPIAVPGSAVASGLIAGWTPSKGPYAGTAAAILPLGEWLVKFRYSSTRGDGHTAAAVVRSAIAALGWPATIPAAPAAQPIAACPDALRFRGKAKAVAPDFAASMLGAMLAGMPRTGKAADPVQPVREWCRDAATVPMGGVYRAGGQTDAYLLALSDSGRGMSVGPSATGILNKSSKPSWGVELFTPGTTLIYPQQDRLPSPDQMLAIANGTPTGSVTTWGKTREITVSTESLTPKK
ncbi:hypothetical protein [uncultured Sphingomonas sp.]|uniref:hypothetical protein n=1 Tax=uncultured Sphingomonas sp. TaxID=158754 RepID=UPI0025F03651|nr:hypothetical protein [uncultured Sphingomonas sp.]